MKKTMISLLLVAVCLLTACAPPAFTANSDIQSLLKDAQKHFSQGNYEEAILTYNQIIKIEPNNFDARFGLGQSYRANKQYNKAILAFKAARTLQPNNTDVVLELGGVLIENKNYQEAQTLVLPFINDAAIKDKAAGLLAQALDGAQLSEADVADAEPTATPAPTLSPSPTATPEPTLFGGMTLKQVGDLYVGYIRKNRAFLKMEDGRSIEGINHSFNGQVYVLCPEKLSMADLNLDGIPELLWHAGELEPPCDVFSIKNGEVYEAGEFNSGDMTIYRKNESNKLIYLNKYTYSGDGDADYITEISMQNGAPSEKVLFLNAEYYDADGSMKTKFQVRETEVTKAQFEQSLAEYKASLTLVGKVKTFDASFYAGVPIETAFIKALNDYALAHGAEPYN